MAIDLGEVFGGKMLCNYEFPTQCGNFLIFERGSIISHNILRYTETTNNVVQDELRNLFFGYVG